MAPKDKIHFTLSSWFFIFKRVMTAFNVNSKDLSFHSDHAMFQLPVSQVDWNLTTFPISNWTAFSISLTTFPIWLHFPSVVWLHFPFPIEPQFPFHWLHFQLTSFPNWINFQLGMHQLLLHPVSLVSKVEYISKSVLLFICFLGDWFLDWGHANSMQVIQNLIYGTRF